MKSVFNPENFYELKLFSFNRHKISNINKSALCQFYPKYWYLNYKKFDILYFQICEQSLQIPIYLLCTGVATDPVEIPKSPPQNSVGKGGTLVAIGRGDTPSRDVIGIVTMVPCAEHTPEYS